MKLISLNIWGGKIFEPLMEFVRKESEDADFFCLQEVFDSPEEKTLASGARANMLALLTAALPDFQGYFAPEQDGFDLWGPANVRNVSLGKATFVRRSIPVLEEGSFFVYRERNGILENDVRTMPKNVHYVSAEVRGERYLISNFHGLWFPYEKMDTDERIAQSKRIRAFLDAREEKKVLCGDFNLAPETESMATLEEGMKNLITAFHIPTTRSSFWKHGQRFADYALVSPDVKVENFTVPDVAISDHLPLILACP